MSFLLLNGLSPVPSGIASLPLYNLQTIIANASSFQAWSATEDANSARDKIFMSAVPFTKLAERPFALIDFGDDHRFEINSSGARNHYKPSGSLKLMFEAEIPGYLLSDYAGAIMWFMNNVGAVLNDMILLLASSISSISFSFDN